MAGDIFLKVPIELQAPDEIPSSCQFIDAFYLKLHRILNFELIRNQRHGSEFLLGKWSL